LAKGRASERASEPSELASDEAEREREYVVGPRPGGGVFVVLGDRVALLWGPICVNKWTVRFSIVWAEREREREAEDEQWEMGTKF